MEWGKLLPPDRFKLSFYADEVSALLAIQRAFSSQLDPEKVIQMTADEARWLTSTDMSVVYLLNQEQLEIRAVSGCLGKNLLGKNLPVEGTLAGRAIQANQPLLICDAHKCSLNYSALVEGFNAKGFLAVPLRTPDELLGVVLVASRFAGELGKNDLRLLELVLPGAAGALVNARRFIRAQRLAALEERRRLMHDLQARLAQSLFSASLIADILPRLVERDPQEGRSRMEELREITREALTAMRSLLTDD